MKVILPRPGSFWRFWFGPVGKVLLALLLVGGVTGAGVFSYYWNKYSRLIDRKLSGGPFNTPSKIFAAPEAVYVGQPLRPGEVVSRLRNAGYSESSANRNGWYRVRADAVEIFPGVDSYFTAEPAVVKFAGNKVARIVSLRDNTDQSLYDLEPELITNLFDKSREKRRLVRFEEIPPILRNAIIAIEDKRFFEHRGFDPLRLIKAAYIDLREMRKEQGASTLSQQLARSFFLYQDKRWTRKVAELLITLQPEQRLSKEQIFEFYCNQIYLGRRGSFNIHGIGEAAQAYFGKDFRDLSLPEAATVAGIIQRPGYFDPFRNPDRVRDRRNLVLYAMLQNDFITKQQYEDAVKVPLGVAASAVESSDAPYFVDLINEQLQARFPEKDLVTQVYRVYTTLDLNLQRAAVEAVRYGMPLVDEQIKRQRRFRGKTPPVPQCALVALDPHTGEVKALLGGRNYGMSQLNRVVAKRQPGSSFKPFVYAAALESALEPATGPILTPVSAIEDAPTTFWFDGKPYEPSNFKHEFHGMTTLRMALAKSMNIATVKVAETVGYDKVVGLARRAGMNLQIQPTPAVALGAYEVQPLEVAGAYTIFANGGVRLDPYMIRAVRAQTGRTVLENKPKETPVLDPRIAYMMTNLLEEVMRSGTAAGTRARGFTVPAAGKTGSSRDGWFAGYTSNLLCIVWVGLDDNTDLEIEGAKSALPIWTEFMKKAITFRAYRNPAPFEPVDGIVTAEVDPETQELATLNCPGRRTEVFIAGTQPAGYCRVHGGRPGSVPLLTTVAGWDTEPEKAKADAAVMADAKPAPLLVAPEHPRAAARTITIPVPPQKAPAADPPKKKGFFSRIWGVFK
ncbi:MAG: PBP1A family penicillin-binding protein [Acidobacteria bacterium]|nr:PBP1A family penicillin-binding protein [Acidobacteriota bacterium]